MAREKIVETKLKRQIESVGGACEKFKGSVRGEPDRLCSFRNGYHCLVETKWAPGVQPESHQLRRHKFWRDRGLDVWVVCDVNDIATVLHAARLSVGSRDVSG